MGDDGRIYCKPDLPAAFKSDIVPIASVLTPNQFEAELLTGLAIRRTNDAIAVCKALHEKGPHTVVISSLQLKGEENYVTIIASTLVEQEGRTNSGILLKLHVPRLSAYFTGTGDLFTALLLAWLYKYPHDLKKALENTVAGLQAVLRDTAKYAANSSELGKSDGSEESDRDMRSAEVCRARELRIVQNQDLLVNPKLEYQAEILL